MLSKNNLNKKIKKLSVGLDNKIKKIATELSKEGSEKYLKKFAKKSSKVAKIVAKKFSKFAKISSKVAKKVVKKSSKKAGKTSVVTLNAIGLAMVRLIEMKYFRPVTIVLLICFLCFNGGFFIKELVDGSKSKKSIELVDVISIRVVNKGKVLDVDQVQIYERVVERGDTILGFLLNIGLGEDKVVQVLSSLKKILDPRDIVVGNSLVAKYNVKLKYDDEKRITGKVVFLDEFKIVTSPEVEYSVKKDQDSFAAKKIIHKFTKKTAKYEGTINEGLFVDVTKAGASANAVMNMIALYGYDVDFQRDIRSGDKFEMVVEAFYNKGGKKVKDGNVLFAMLDLANKRKIAMYAHRKKNGYLEYFDKKGNSVKKSLLRTPISGARVSSGFGMRRHPVLGYSKLHKGVDFAARRGTPIFAAGDGKIVRRGRNGGYGNYIKIKHNSIYHTAYAHMKSFNRRFKRGSKVKQGDVIGYVGTTGRSTGPHLHFEVQKKGKAINPSRVKAVSGTRLKGSELTAFKKAVKTIEAARK